jgi:hypothetical protein
MIDLILFYAFRFLDNAFIFCLLIFVAYCLASVIGIIFEKSVSFEPEVVLYIDEEGNLVPRDSAKI